MKKILILLLLVSSFSLAAKQDILTTWLIEEKKEHGNNVIIEFVEENDGTISGYIRDLANKTGLLTDELNKDPELKGQPLIGMKFIKDFQYQDDDNRYINGKIYDPTRGSWWNARAYVDKENKKIYLKGSLDKYGIIGLTKVWRSYPRKTFNK